MPQKTNQSKKEAIFQLCNFLCNESITQITDLANGHILFKLIEARFPPFSEEKVQPTEVAVLRNNTESNGINIKNENLENEYNPATKEKDIFLQHIKNFIDGHYNIKSENMIEYEKCLNFDEFEIIKVTVFVLSEIIKHLYETNSEDLMSLFHFDVKFQVELEAIFKLFITEREKLSKEEIEKLFSKANKKASPFTTPRRTSARHREQLTESISTPKEDIYTNSPLKTYFESPVFKKEGVWMKEKVKCYEKTLEEGDEIVSDLECKITKLESELKNKEKDLKCLQKKLDEKEEDNQSLRTNIESLKVESERSSKELIKKMNDYELVKGRVAELTSQIEQLQMVIVKEEKPNTTKSRKSSSRLYENSILNSKEDEIAILKKKIRNLEIKNYSYKRELADKVLEELHEKEPPGVRNDSYEEVWSMVDLDRIEREQLLSTIIVADNRKLSAELNVAQLENERLLKEIQNLKKKLVGKNRKSGTSELKETSQTPETEQFRKSSNETSYILNSSDYLIPCEQSVISSEPEALPYSEKPSEAVLWKMYDSQMPETGSAYINLNQDSVISVNSNLDVMNDLQLSNIKIENTEPNSLLNRKNKYVLENLNFDTFLNELKKLTKNGSFQKVLQVFGKRQKEINGTNGCNRLDLQEMLKMITECVCVAVALNAESSATNLEDKCCSTDEKELCTVIKLNIELDKLKNQLSAASQKHENDLKACKNELEELNKEKNRLEKKYQASSQVLSDRKRTFDELYKKYREQTLKIESVNRKYFDLKKSYESLLDENKKKQIETIEFRKISASMCRKKRCYEKQHKLSQEENTKLKTELRKLKEENEKLLKEKEAFGSAAFLREPSRDSSVGLSSHFNIKPELHSTTFQENSNESILSGVFRKNISHYVSENEDDFCHYRSLNPIKKEYDDDRVEEIKRRNSLYPRQMQSSYPLEADLNTTYNSLYVQDKCKEQHHSKKLKLGDVITEETSFFETPISKPKRKLETPLSFHRLMKRIKHMKTPTKPKGSSS